MKANKYLESLLHMIFPMHCYGCGSEAVNLQQPICFNCIAALPLTQFSVVENNLVEKIFTGRINIVAATSMYFFNKSSVLQTLMHQLKYDNKPEIGIELGKLLGQSIAETDRFKNVDYLTPVPLSKKRQHTRGYNQALEICKGISEVTQIAIADSITYRIKDNETQTKKTRQERWENMQDVFAVKNSELLQNKNVMLVDDVVTTGATLETCAAALQKSAAVSTYVATIAIAANY